jgi:iron complex outermembrane receptor protein
MSNSPPRSVWCSASARPALPRARAGLLGAALAAAPLVLSPLAASRLAAQELPASGAAAAAPGARELRGRVVDEEGRPIAGAAVTAGAASARTDADGRFLVRLAPSAAPGEPLVVLRAVADGHAAVARPLPAGAMHRRSCSCSAAAWSASAPCRSRPRPPAREPHAVAQSTTTVGAAELTRAGGATLAGSLGAQPGVSVRTDGPGASAPIVRGLSGERVLVLHDGVRANDLAASAPDHGVTIDPLAVRRVEIVRGPAALLYGPNAVGGVVHVISDDVPLARPARAERAVAVQAEQALPGAGASIDWTTPLGRSAGDADDATGWVLRARAGARAHGDQRLGAGAATARLGNTALDARHGALGVGRAWDGGAAGVAYRGYGFAYGMPVVTAGDEPVRLEGARHEVLARAETRRGGGPFVGARADVSAQWYEHRELVQDAAAMTLGANTQSLQLVARTRDGRWLRDGAVGVQGTARRNGVDGELALTPPTRGGTAGAFLFQELAPFGAVPTGTVGLRALRLPLGVRWDATRVDAETSTRFGAARRRAFGGVSGAVGLTMPLATGVSVGANLARAVRAPSAEELYSEAGHAGTGAFEIGDATLGTERTIGSDVVLRVERARVTAQLAGYRNRVAGWVGLYPTGRDTIAPDGAGGTKALPLYRISQRAATLAGAEAALEVALGGAGRSGRGLVVGAMADVLRARDSGGDALPFMPPARVGAHLRWDDGGREAGVRLRHALVQRRVPDGEAATAAYTLVDLHAAWPLPIGGRTHALTLRVDNATDALWRDAASRVKAFAPGMGRNVVLGWRVGW